MQRSYILGSDTRTKEMTLSQYVSSLFPQKWDHLSWYSYVCAKFAQNNVSWHWYNIWYNIIWSKPVWQKSNDGLFSMYIRPVLNKAWVMNDTFEIRTINFTHSPSVVSQKLHGSELRNLSRRHMQRSLVITTVYSRRFCHLKRILPP